MELIDIEVGNLIDGTVVVEFKGEGRESVSVEMAVERSLERDAAILRAREILIQLAIFGDLAGEDRERPEEPFSGWLPPHHSASGSANGDA